MSIETRPDSDWFNGTAGRYLLIQEQAWYDNEVFDLFGFNALQMGCLHMDLLRNSRIPNRYLSADSVTATQPHHISCCDDFLPFADASLDLLVLPHRLEFSERPHQTLREVARVMMPEGHLLISGFNPTSTWGATARMNAWFCKNKTYPWNGEFIGLTRLKDWLALLGFEVMWVDKRCHIPPFEQASWHKRFTFGQTGRPLRGCVFNCCKKTCGRHDANQAKLESASTEICAGGKATKIKYFTKHDLTI